ncbi:NADPH-dependent FMN reductase [Candidatus Mycoplasma haematobovis]|uniref:NADPH-dependent FMN reductase n=1 Tax=Candidatus Mycoplasma haematobovis TaxID=432608 RepID=UPI001650A88E|nr:NADPH-dependent FMN reductase [Candidatus Mycoplasma haematobovis]
MSLKKILLISASNSEPSINNEILQEIVKKTEFDSLNLLKYSNIPMLVKFQKVPEEIHELYLLFKEYETLVFFAPEHNGYISAFFKNIIDWLSRIEIDFLKSKNVLFISASITERISRIMQAGVENTFTIFNPKSFEFMNINRYGKSIQENSEKIKDILEKVKTFL